MNGGGVLALEDCNLSGNTSWAKPGTIARGGAISIGSSTLSSVTGTVFSDNLARSSDRDGGAPNDAYGGVIAVYQGTLGTISRSEFNDNEVRGGSSTTHDGSKGLGGAISLEGGTLCWCACAPSVRAAPG